MGKLNAKGSDHMKPTCHLCRRSQEAQELGHRHCRRGWSGSRAQANSLQRLQLDSCSLPKWAAGELISFTPRRCREVKHEELQIAEHQAQLRAEARWGDSALKTGLSESWHVKDMPTNTFSSHLQPLPGSDTVPPAWPTLSRRLLHSQKELNGLREKTQRNWVPNNPWILLPPSSEAEHAEFPVRVL